MNIELLERKENLLRELERIKDIIIHKYAPEKIILFGSLANGNIHEWSDIDLVIIKETKERFIKRLHEIRLMIKPQEGVDFIVYTPREVEDMQKRENKFLVKEILEEGKIIYEKRQ